MLMPPPQATAIQVGTPVVTPDGRVGSVSEMSRASGRDNDGALRITAWVKFGADGPCEGPWPWRDLRPATLDEAERAWCLTGVCSPEGKGKKKKSGPRAEKGLYPELD